MIGSATAARPKNASDAATSRRRRLLPYAHIPGAHSPCGLHDLVVDDSG